VKVLSHLFYSLPWFQLLVSVANKSGVFRYISSESSFILDHSKRVSKVSRSQLFSIAQNIGVRSWTSVWWMRILLTDHRSSINSEQFRSITHLKITKISESLASLKSISLINIKSRDLAGWLFKSIKSLGLESSFWGFEVVLLLIFLKYFQTSLYYLTR
jgi:hypothetical protein